MAPEPLILDNSIYSSLNVPPKVMEILQIPDLQTLITSCLDSSISEIVAPSLERSVSIAIIAANQIALKDFATETNVNLLKSSVLTMAQTFACGIATAICRESLRTVFDKKFFEILTS